MNISYTITKSDKFENVKDVLKGYFYVSDRLLSKLKNNHKITLNNSICSINDKVCVNDIISFIMDFEEDNSNIVPYKMNLDIIYEDDFYLVVNKPSSIAIHPSLSHYDNSLSNGIKYYFDCIRIKKEN